MIDSSLIPSPLLVENQSSKVDVSRTQDISFRQSFGLSLRLAVWSVRAIGARIRKRQLDGAMAKEICSIIEDFGGLWVKVGQLLSLRTDLLSPEFIRELSRLQYAAVGFPFDIARNVIEKELGQTIEAVFSEFDEQPIAAASICQVHKARLRSNGAQVAVKAQRPGIEKRFSRDLAMLRFLIKSMKILPAMGFFTWDEMLWEIDQIFLEEVDYHYEAANTKRLRKSLRRHDIFVPKVYDCSTSKLLVLEWISGVLMSKVLDMSREEPLRVKRWYHDNNISSKKVGEALFLTFFRQLFEDNLFHGDLHPGNILLLRDNRIALIDFGSVGRNDATMLHNYKMSMKGISEKDFPMAVDYLFLICECLVPVDVEKVKPKLVNAYQSWSKRADLSELPYYEKSISNMGMEVGEPLQESHIIMSWSFMKISRTWSTLDASLGGLLPDVNYTNLVAKYFKAAEKRTLRKLKKKGPSDLFDKLYSLQFSTNLKHDNISQRSLNLRAEPSKGERVLSSVFTFCRRILVLVLLVLLALSGIGETGINTWF